MKKSLLILLLITSSTHAAETNLKWDANNPEPESYSVYQAEEGQAYDYTNPAWTGTQTTCTLTGLDDCKIYKFVVRANACGNQSDDSNEIKTVIVKPEAPKNLMQ